MCVGSVVCSTTWSPGQGVYSSRTPRGNMQQYTHVVAYHPPGLDSRRTPIRSTRLSFAIMILVMRGANIYLRRERVFYLHCHGLTSKVRQMCRLINAPPGLIDLLYLLLGLLLTFLSSPLDLACFVCRSTSCGCRSTSCGTSANPRKTGTGAATRGTGLLPSTGTRVQQNAHSLSPLHSRMVPCRHLF